MVSIPIRQATAALLAATVGLSAWPGAQAEDSMIGCNQDAMLTFDASGSMASMGYNGLDIPRIFEARDALRTTLPRIAPFRRLGLVVYGPGQRDACSNVEVRLLPTFDAAVKIIQEVDRTQPEGETPLTSAVEAAADALHYREQPRHRRAGHRRSGNLRRLALRAGRTIDREWLPTSRFTSSVSRSEARPSTPTASARADTRKAATPQHAASPIGRAASICLPKARTSWSTPCRKHWAAPS